MKRWREDGFTVLEMIVAIAVASILIVAVTVFVGRAFGLSREHFEQVRITEDARINMERLSDTIRNARYVDCDADGFTDTAWLVKAEGNDLIIVTNIDNDETSERVRYWLDPNTTELKRGLTQLTAACAADGEEQTEVLVRTVRNATQVTPVPVFSYYTGPDRGGAQLTTPVDDVTAVARVGMRLIIDVNEQQYPPAADVQTDVALRTSLCAPGECGALACEEKSPTAQVYDYADARWMDKAYEACKAYCPTNGNLPVGQCCGWDVDFARSLYLSGGNLTGDITALCTCSEYTRDIPAGNAQNVSYQVGGAAYTNFANDCLEGRICAGGVRGVPECDPGCLDPATPGQCACNCGS